MNLLIHNILTVTNDDRHRILSGHAVAVEQARIKELGEEPELKKKYGHFQQIDGGGRLLMPGLINAHMHFYSTFARGLVLRRQPKNFAEILSGLWWRLDTALDAEAVYYSALVPAIAAVKQGVTAVIDHHASANAVANSLDRIEAALELIGLRGVLCYEVSDRDGPEIRRHGLEENARYIEKCQKAKEANPDHLFDGMVGLHASFTLDDESLTQAAQMSHSLKRGCHIHLLEDGVDRVKTKEEYGREVVDRLLAFGILGEKSIAAHAIHVTAEEIDLLAQSDTMVVHNPCSNMNNAVGRTDIFTLLEKGLLVGLGTDGMSPDLKPDIRAGYLLHKHHLQNPNLGWNEFQQMVLNNNAAIFHRVSGQKVGKIAQGYLADLILVDYFPPTPLTAENFWGHFLFGIADAVVDTTIVNGQIVMRGKLLTNIDEGEIAAQSRACAERVWQRFLSMR
ncbi:MAG: putative aminohydrolase SsnA [bacterium]